VDSEIERRFLLLENEVKRLRSALKRKAVKGKVDLPEAVPFECNDERCDGLGHDKTCLGFTLPCYQEHVRERARQIEAARIEEEVAERVRKKKIRQGVSQSK